MININLEKMICSGIDVSGIRVTTNANSILANKVRLEYAIEKDVTGKDFAVTLLYRDGEFWLDHPDVRVVAKKTSKKVGLFKKETSVTYTKKYSSHFYILTNVWTQGEMVFVTCCDCFGNELTNNYIPETISATRGTLSLTIDGDESSFRDKEISNAHKYRRA